MSNYITVQPSYGRQLRSKQQVWEHFNNDRDFDILSVVHGPGKKINRKEAKEHGFSLEIRYGKNGEKVMIL